MIKKYSFTVLGPMLLMVMLFLPTPEGMKPEAFKVAAIALMMVVWWITEAVPIAVTALLPLVMFPLFEVSSIAQSALGYSNHLIFLFIGGFVIALCLERWNVHQRVALAILSILGTSSRRMVLGFMVCTGFISMWISNTATTMMMLPIASAIVVQLPTMLKDHYGESEAHDMHKNIGKALMLGIAYSASIGGIGTLIGTPPNAVLAGTLKELFQYEISFFEWMLVGVPFSIVFIFLSWILLVKIFKLNAVSIPGAQLIIKQRKQELGPISANEGMVLVIFILTALSWITRKWLITPFFPKVNDSVIALFSAILLFAIPVSKDKRNEKGPCLMDWASAVKLPWGVVLLFGGGFSLAKAVATSGLSTWIGEKLAGIAGLSIVVVIMIIVALVTFLTEVTSNTASTNLLMPIMASLATALGYPPVVIMGVTAIAASCAFMLPVATPPNAIVFGSGYIKVKEMAKVGIILNIMSVVLVMILGRTLMPWVLAL